MASVEHEPDRPSWDCRVCGQQWPCEPARVHLAEDTGGGTALALLTFSYLERYVLDIGDGPLGDDVFRRFIGWSRGL